MRAYFEFLNDTINTCKSAFKTNQTVNWLNPYQADQFIRQREVLLRPLLPNALFKETKPVWGDISQGCKLCGAGQWSCLFITGKCNAKCFYCPTDQSEDCVPTSQGMTFATPEAYAEYINHFGFKGASFSGGEPLLVFDRVMDYLTALRRDCDPNLYVWMYTNGMLASVEKFQQLADAGINEVRFDIGATNYSLDAIKMAQGIIPNITVEIPAVPQKLAFMKEHLQAMIDAGVTRLNLHQMRLTEYNAEKLFRYDYTYIPAERPLVLESELAALEIMQYAAENQLPISINYCSFFFKFRFQKAGFRRIIAEKLCGPETELTEKGFIRNACGDTMVYEGMTLRDGGAIKGGEALTLKHKTYSFERARAGRACGQTWSPELVKSFENGQLPTSDNELDLWKHEAIEHGLREY